MTTYRRDSDPSERPLAFNGRDHPQRRSPAPVTLLLSLILLAVVGGGVFFLYRGGARSPSGPPEPVGAPIRDVRVAAPPQADTPDPAAGLSIYKDDPNAAPPAPTFAPPPETPTARPIASAAAAAPAAAGPIAAAPAGASAVASAAIPAPVAIPKVKAAKAPSIDTILADAGPTPKAVAPVKATAADKPSGGHFIVQIGAFSSQAQADKSWTSAAGVAPGAMAGKGKKVAQTTKDGATLYRVAITGFDTREAANALCAKLTASGRTCFVR